MQFSGDLWKNIGKNTLKLVLINLNIIIVYEFLREKINIKLLME